MLNEKVKSFLDTIRNSEELQDEIKENTQGKEQEDVLKYYAGLASRLDFGVTEDDLRAFFEEREKSLKARTDAVIQQAQELSLDDLDAVAGGGGSCANSFSQKENCYLLDGCDQVIVIYDKYECQHNEAGAHCGSDATQDCQGIIW